MHLAFLVILLVVLVATARRPWLCSCCNILRGDLHHQIPAELGAAGTVVAAEKWLVVLVVLPLPRSLRRDIISSLRADSALKSLAT